MTTTDTTSFSAMLRESTTSDHRNAERSPFMTKLLQGKLPLAGYTDMLAQHAYAYEVLENPSEEVASDPNVARFLDENLNRTEALETDLRALVGENWREVHPPTEATEAFVARLREVGRNWGGGHVAHHYTRYMGDLSGGQIIGQRCAAAYGLEEGVNDNFARFDRIGDLDAYKNRYRAELDAADWHQDEKQRIVDEIQNAYALNAAVLADLSHHGA